MAESELNNDLLNIVLRDNAISKQHSFTGKKVVRVDSDGILHIDFGDATEAPVQSIPKAVVNWESITNAGGIKYLGIDGVHSVDASIHNRKSLLPRKYKIIALRVNARSATIGSGESVDIHVMDDTTATTATVTLDETYTQNTIKSWSGTVDMISDYLAIRIDPTSLGAGSIQFLHIGIELIPLEE